MAESKRTNLESYISNFFGKDHCILVGRGTTGLSLIYQCSNITGEVIYPAYTCASSVYATSYTEATPVFADVQDDYTISVESLINEISSETDAVLAIHLFGHPAKMDEIKRICKQNDLLLIEDACQSLGTKYKSEVTGSLGDISVISFGHKKHIDAGGGGAVLTDDSDLAKDIRNTEKTIPRRKDDYISNLFDGYRDIYYTVDKLREQTSDAKALYRPLPEAFSDLFHYGFKPKWSKDIQSGFNSLDEICRIRQNHATIYRDELQHPKIIHPKPIGEPVYFRYSVQMENKKLRDHIVSHLRKHDYHVSTLYTPVPQQFGDNQGYETTDLLARRTINLWVSPKVDAEYVQNCCNCLLEGIKQF